jgi:GNAT superfamily N-acetyltransferase
MEHIRATVQTPIHDSFRVQQVIGLFDLPARASWSETFSAEVPDLSQDWTVGCIIGPSGSGKSTLARAAFGPAMFEPQPWPAQRAVIDSLGDAPIQRITQMLTAVGLGSPPAWLKPFAVLSNGEKFRCELARALLTSRGPLVVFDEFTSVVDRTVAQVASAALGRLLRSKRWPLRFVAVSCHADIVPWLEPDWVLDLGKSGADGPPLSWVRLRRPRLTLQVTQCRQSLWPLFARHHYLSGGLSAGATCYAACLGERPIAFCALVAQLGRKGCKRISRLVTLPDYQGLGIGQRLAECVADHACSQGWRVSITTSHPAVIGACRKSSLWRLRSWKPLGYLWRQKIAERAIPSSAGRGVASFKYCGDERPENFLRSDQP